VEKNLSVLRKARPFQLGDLALAQSLEGGYGCKN